MQELGRKAVQASTMGELRGTSLYKTAKYRNKSDIKPNQSKANHEHRLPQKQKDELEGRGGGTSKGDGMPYSYRMNKLRMSHAIDVQVAMQDQLHL